MERNNGREMFEFISFQRGNVIPVTVRVFENFPHEWPRRAGISPRSKFKMRDQVLSHVDSYPFAPTSSLSSKFFLPSNGRNLFPRELCSPFRFEKRNPIVTGKLTKKKKGRKKEEEDSWTHFEIILSKQRDIYSDCSS